MVRAGSVTNSSALAVCKGNSHSATPRNSSLTFSVCLSLSLFFFFFLPKEQYTWIFLQSSHF